MRRLKRCAEDAGFGRAGDDNDMLPAPGDAARAQSRGADTDGDVSDYVKKIRLSTQPGELRLRTGTCRRRRSHACAALAQVHDGRRNLARRVGRLTP